MLKDKTLISTATLAGSLFSYWYAKAATKDVLPFVMVGGFIGTLIGEAIADFGKEVNQNNTSIPQWKG